MFRLPLNNLQTTSDTHSMCLHWHMEWHEASCACILARRLSIAYKKIEQWLRESLCLRHYIYMYVVHVCYSTTVWRRNKTSTLVAQWSLIHFYHMSNSCECMGVNGEALQLHAADCSSACGPISISRCAWLGEIWHFWNFWNFFRLLAQAPGNTRAPCVEFWDIQLTRECM